MRVNVFIFLILTLYKCIFRAALRIVEDFASQSDSFVISRGKHGLLGEQQLLEFEQWRQCQFSGFIVANENGRGLDEFDQPVATASHERRPTEFLRLRSDHARRIRRRRRLRPLSTYHDAEQPR